MTDPIRVLFVAADPHLAESTATALERVDERIVVETVQGADAALERLSPAVDCVVGDADVAGTDGRGLLSAVRERRPSLPFVLVAREGAETTVGDAVAAGVADYVRADDGDRRHERLAHRVRVAVERARADAGRPDGDDRTDDGESVRRKAAKLDVLFENSPTMISVHDAEGRIRDANGRLRSSLGHDDGALIGTRVWEIDEEIGPAEARAMWRGMAVGETRELEGRYRRRDGSTFPVEVSVAKVEIGGAVRFFVISRDVSEDVEREYERTVFERGIAQIEVGVGAYDETGTVTLLNDHYARLLGRTPTELRGSKAWETNPELDAERFDDYWASYDVGETRVHETVHRRFDTDEEFPVRTTTTRVEVDGDDYHVGTVSDITEQVERERQLEREIERLDEFARIVSHDLRNPLNVAQGRLRLAREEHDSPHLEDVERSLDRMGELIGDILALAREDEAVREPEPVDLAELVDACWRGVDTGDATLAVDTDRTVRADEGRLRQLFENLVRNAVEHGDDDAVVTVGDLPDGFFLADDGAGIDPADLEDVFDAGYSTDTEGTGLGLSIAQRIAEAHGWTIAATNGADGGARFEIVGVEPVD